MLASLPARRGGDPFPSHPIVWILLSAMLVVVLVAKPRSSPRPADSLAVPATPVATVEPSDGAAVKTADYAWLSRTSAKAYQPLEARIAPPEGFVRVAVKPRSFGDWLRRLPLRPEGSAVLNGAKKPVIPATSAELAAVVDLQPGNGNFLNAANIVLRLRGEYLWSCGPRETIRFSFTNGEPFDWKQWKSGARPAVSGRQVTWSQNETPDDSRRSYTGYLETLFKYSSVYSLFKDTQPVSDETVQPGDVFVVPGRPGHAVVVLDVATNPSGEVRALLGQGGSPPRTFHVLSASRGSPWFELRAGSGLTIPGWGPVSLKQLRRW